MDFAPVGDAFDALCRAVAGPDYTTNPPDGFFSVSEYAKRTGLSENASATRLRTATKEGRIRRVLVKNGRTLMNYYGAA